MVKEVLCYLRSVRCACCLAAPCAGRRARRSPSARSAAAPSAPTSARGRTPGHWSLALPMQHFIVSFRKFPFALKVFKLNPG